MDSHRRRLSLVLTAALAAVLYAAPPAAAQTEAIQPKSGSFTFTGRGWGHGLGMSQWGAKGLADAGWPADKILAHYYTGTALAVLPGPTYGTSPNTIRIGLFQGSGSQRVTGNGTYEIVETGGRVAATVPAGQTWRLEPTADGRIRLVKPDGSQHAVVGNSSNPVFVRFEPHSTILQLPDVGYRYRYGLLEIEVYASGGSHALRGILTLDFEKYLYGLGEVPSSWPVEVLKAQAIAARTYALEKTNRLGQNRAGCNCALYSTVSDQAYIGYEKEAGAQGDRWVKAVNDTRGMVSVDGGGKPIQAYYSASSGGHTEDNEKQWGGSAISYLRGVCDPGDWASGSNPHSNWTLTLDEPTVRERLASGGVNIGTIERIELLEPRGVSGRVVREVDASNGGVRVVGSTGSARLSGDRLRSLLRLKSNLLSPPLFGGIRARWNQLGCAPGRPLSAEYGWSLLDGSSWGRAQNFKKGRLFWEAATHDVFWNYGGILAKYDALRAAKVKVGGPTSDEYPVSGGRAVNYQRGRIYWSAETGTNVVLGGILNRYLQLGGPDSHLRLPIRDEEGAPGGRRTRFQGGMLIWNRETGEIRQVYGAILGRWEALKGAPAQPLNEEYTWTEVGGANRGRAQDFTSGRLFWNRDTGKVWWVYGGILAKYDALRDKKTDLRMPLTDEQSVSGGRAVNFEGGRIYWSRDTGAAAVWGAIGRRYVELGAHDSYLRLPLRDEEGAPGGRRTRFQGGMLIWNRETGEVKQVYGAVLGRWEHLKGAPGQPRNEEYTWRELAGANRGRAQDFTQGRLFWNRDTGKVFWVYGGILAKYDELRGTSTDLRMPLTDEHGVKGGRAVNFENGRIYWSSQTGAKATWGAILARYLSEGGPDSRLGLPTSDEYSWNGMRRSDFQGGYITWTPSDGARVHYP